MRSPPRRYSPRRDEKRRSRSPYGSDSKRARNFSPDPRSPKRERVTSPDRAYDRARSPARRAQSPLEMQVGVAIDQNLVHHQERLLTLMTTGEDDPPHPDKTRATILADHRHPFTLIVVVWLLPFLILLLITLVVINHRPRTTLSIPTTTTLMANRHSPHLVPLQPETARMIGLHLVVLLADIVKALPQVRRVPCLHITVAGLDLVFHRDLAVLLVARALAMQVVTLPHPRFEAEEV